MIPLFSPNGLQHSLVISVCVGVLITTLMFERYGWVFSGLVVPGYLAPIFAIYPMSALTIVAEAIVTVVIVKVISNSAWRFRTHTPLFGRERFFMIVLVALIVRLGVEEFLLPQAARVFFPGRTDILARVRDFGAIGLVVVPLTANLLWKPGLVKGLMQVGGCTLGVLVVIYGILTPLTNYNLAQLGAVYEDVSIDFALSAKLQIIIICGCVLAAKMNLLEGWDFGGILLPPLIAISLLQPPRLLGTLAEVLLVVYLGQRIVKLPVMNRITWAGPRLVTFCFTLCVALKFVIGWIFYLIEPQWNATDFLGFGYILSSLLAIKLWNKSSRVTIWPTIYVSAATFLLGTAVSFSLASASRWIETGTRGVGPGSVPVAEDLPVEFAVLERMSPGLGDIQRVEQAVATRRRMAQAGDRILDELRRGSSPEEAVAAAAAELSGAEASVRYVKPAGSPPYAMITPVSTEDSDLETVFIRLVGGTRTMLFTAPGGEPLPTYLAAAALAKSIQPSVIVLDNWSRGEDLQAAPRFDSLTAWALRSLPMRPAIEIEGSPTPGASLDVHGSLPGDALSVADLRKVIPALEVFAPGRADAPRLRWISAHARGGYERLRLDLSSASALLVALVPDSGDMGEAMAPLERYLGPYMDAMQARRPGLAVSPQQWSKARLIVLKAGLVRLMVEAQEVSRHREVGSPELSPMNFLARVLGLEMDLLVEPGGERRFLVLRNREGDLELDGAVILGLGDWRELHVEVSNPRRYPNSHRLGTQVYLAGKCRALTIAGLSSGDAGVLAPEVAKQIDRMSLFQIAHQVLVERASVAGTEPPHVLQVRGRSLPEEGDDGVLVPPDVILPTVEAAAAETAPWLRIFSNLGWNIRVQAPDEPGGYDIGSPLQSRYRRFLRYEGVSGLWADPDVRRALRGPQDDPAAIAALKQLGSEDGGFSVVKWWRDAKLGTATGVPQTLEAAMAGVAAYARSGNLAELSAGIDAARQAGWRDLLIVDQDAEAPILVFVSPEGAEAVAVNLAATVVRGQELGIAGKAETVDELLRLRRFFVVGRRK
ncbi:MAG: poly-gamma-glutamate biosynthesis protein PgsC/CapC [Planctomycetes bacterium]|nr:poly-gamma-glutamate biosynthesis protein PgsC/CapC [Planctomycetota bacterium]